MLWNEKSKVTRHLRDCCSDSFCVCILVFMSVLSRCILIESRVEGSGEEAEEEEEEDEGRGRGRESGCMAGVLDFPVAL